MDSMPTFCAWRMVRMLIIAVATVLSIDSSMGRANTNASCNDLFPNGNTAICMSVSSSRNTSRCLMILYTHQSQEIECCWMVEELEELDFSLESILVLVNLEY